MRAVRPTAPRVSTQREARRTHALSVVLATAVAHAAASRNFACATFSWLKLDVSKEFSSSKLLAKNCSCEIDSFDGSIAWFEDVILLLYSQR